MKHRQRVMCFDVMWLVVFVACAALIGRGSGATTHYNETLFHGDQGDSSLDTIRFYLNRTLTSNYDIEECLSEKPNYYLRPHQKLTVIILNFNKNEDIPTDYAYCEWNTKKYESSRLVTENAVAKSIRVQIMNVGNVSGDLIFWKAFYAPYRSCQVHLHLDKNGTYYDITNEMLEDLNNKIHSFHLNATNNKEYNDNEIACFFENKSMYPDWKTGVRLKYYKEWWTEAGDAEVNLDLSTTILLVIIIPLTVMIIVSATYWKLKDIQTRRPNSINNESRSSLTNSNDYQEIYDIVYEDRQRIVRARKLQENKDAPKPCVPPVETIPLCVQPTLKKELPPTPRDVPPPTTESLIPLSDRYLLCIDSDGYEIPDEARFISLPCSNDGR